MNTHTEKSPQFFVRNTITLVACVLFGIFVGFYGEKSHISICSISYSYVNIDTVCNNKNVISKAGYISLENNLSEFIDHEKTVGNVSEVGIYFRDLKVGPVFGINEMTSYSPASLLKLPLAIAYMREEEANKGFINTTLTFEKPAFDFTEVFPSQNLIKAHTTHTIEDLLMHMLAYSDNNAYGLLQVYMHNQNLDDFLDATYIELGFIDPKSMYTEAMSVREYASIFRALYNASYLEPGDSEKILSWLAQADFSRGLVAGIPSGITVAHKFGERFDESGVKQLHDCGIIYYPGNPYLLCIMTRGNNFDVLAGVIQEISKEVYIEVNSRKL